MKRHFWIGALWAAVGGLGILSNSALAATKAERQRASAALVSKALESELAGANDQRMTQLGEALESTPDYAPALWHAGYVRSGKKWLKVDELARQQTQDSRLAAYRLARERQPDTVEGNLELARWCAGKKMREQQRAHLLRVVELAPNHAEARRALGHRLIDGRWRSEAELAQTRERLIREQADLANWRPRIEALRDKLTHDNRRLRDAAREDLGAISDPAAATAIEVVLAPYSEELAKLALAALHGMKSPAASVSIMRIALNSPWQSVRDDAAEKLSVRDKHHYVPYLLAGLAAPVRSQAALFATPTGQVFYRHVFFREGHEQNALGTVDTDYPLTPLHVGTRQEQEAARQVMFAARLDDAASKARAREIAVARQNAVIGASNERLIALLKKVSGEKERNSADSWWAWWDSYNEVSRPTEKPVYTAYGHWSIRAEDPLRYVNAPLPTRRAEPPRQRPHECLVAGTPVWTETGLKPIEQIRIGDRVLAQDVQTGELALKPVIATTERPPEKVLTVQIGSQTLRCTGGHPFWVAGRGWLKARSLEPGQAVHGVEGAATVGKVAEAEDAVTYNLEVADFNNYFVGPDKLLTHDVTSRRPNSAALPGLLRE